MNIPEKVTELIKNVIEENGYHLDEVLYLEENKMNFLRVVIEKDNELTVEDCVTVSKLINPILDEKDPISDNYILDVCSKEKGCE